MKTRLSTTTSKSSTIGGPRAIALEHRDHDIWYRLRDDDGRIPTIDDDEDDFFITSEYIKAIEGKSFVIDWCHKYQDGLDNMCNGMYDLYLVDYRLGAQNGVELLRAAQERGCRAPVILLTGQGEHEIDLEAMKAGAADYLVKGRLDPGLLERSIRYAIERKRATDRAVSDQARLAAFGEDVGLALTRRDSLDTILHRCSTAMVHYLQAALARLWIYQRDENRLQLYASAGVMEEPGPLSSKQPKVTIEMKAVSDGRPILINNLTNDPRVADRDWVRREGIAAYAGYPLMLEDRLIGLMSIFSKTPLTEAILQELASVANGVALCIERKRSAEALDASEVKYRSVVESIKEVIFQIDRDGRWTFLNRAWVEITGFNISESLGKCFTDYIHPDDRQRHGEIMREVIDRKMIYCRDETRYVAADGTFRWMEVYAQPILNGNESAFGISGASRCDRKGFPRYAIFVVF